MKYFLTANLISPKIICARTTHIKKQPPDITTSVLQALTTRNHKPVSLHKHPYPQKGAYELCVNHY